MNKRIVLLIALFPACGTLPAVDVTDGDSEGSGDVTRCHWSQWTADGVEYHVCDAGPRVFSCEIDDGVVTWRYYVYGEQVGNTLHMDSVGACVDRSEAGLTGL